MNIRTLIILLIIAICGVIVPLTIMHAHRARVMEATIDHAVTLTQLLAARAESRLAERATWSLRPWLTEPGVEAVWIVDAHGTMIVHEGTVAAADLAVMSPTQTAPQLAVTADGAIVRFAQSVRSNGATVGTAGMRFAPQAAITALGIPTSALLTLFTWAAIGAAIILIAAKNRPINEARSTRHEARSQKYDLTFLQPIADAFNHPVFIFDPQHRLIIANAAATAQGHLPTDRAVEHLLDFADVAPWGRGAIDLVNTLADGGRRTVHQQGATNLLAARLEQDGAVFGYWLSVEAMPEGTP